SHSLDYHATFAQSDIIGDAQKGRNAKNTVGHSSKETVALLCQHGASPCIGSSLVEICGHGFVMEMENFWMNQRLGPKDEKEEQERQNCGSGKQRPTRAR